MLASYRPLALLVVLSVIWGLAFVAIRQADMELDWDNLTLMRWLIVSAGFLVLYPFIVKPRAKFERKDAPRLFVVALTSVAVYHLALNAAEKTVDASLAGLLISLAPLSTVLLSSLVLHEKITARIWLALGLAVAGAVAISSKDLALGETAVGPGLVVVAAVAGATFTVASKPLVVKYGPFPVAAWAAFLGTAMLLPFVSPRLLTQAESLSSTGWVAVLYLATLSTVVANLIFYTLVNDQAISKLGVQLYLVPIVSAAGGVLILGETLGPEVFAGGALLLLAVGLATRH